MQMRSKRVWPWAAVAALAVLAAAGVLPVSSALRVAAGTAAHNLCSSLFVSDLPSRQTQDELVNTLIGPAKSWLHVSIDPVRQRVETRVLFESAAADFTPGYGCRLVLGHAVVSLPPQPPLAPQMPTTTESFAPEMPVAPGSEALRKELDRLFAEAPGEAPRRVKSVVIVKDGRVVAERYATGFDVDTPVVSFSIAKSITNALLGILVRQGKVSMTAPAPVPEWRGPHDPRDVITPDHLLRMTSGLDAEENGSGFDPSSRMFYDSNDMGGYSASRPLKKPPGTVWDYTSNNTLILDRMMSGIVGGGPALFRQFAQTELFAPMGMNHVTLEFDGAGTFIGASHVYATPRDFARFGLLYLNDGVAPDGRRILPEGWVAYSRRSTLGTSYGAGFWTNDGPSEDAASRVALGFPKDGFFASGNLGQRIYIVPSERMVIARFGYSSGPTLGIGKDLELIAAAIAALKTG